MYKQFLKDGWTFAPGPVIEGEATVKNIPPATANWLTIDVPGDINVALQKHGVVPNAHYDTDAQALYWVTANEWWYQNTFDLDRISYGKMELFFDSLDGICDIWLNGTKLGHSTSAFYPHSYYVRGKLHTKNNHLVLRFHSIDRFFKSSRYSGQTGWGHRRSYLRKPQFNFGWDWALPVPSLGIAGPVRIEYDNTDKIADCSIRTHINGLVEFDFEVVEETLENPYTLRISVDGHGFSETKEINARKIKTFTYFRIENPKLWYPNGYGNPDLYNYKLELLVDGEIRDVKSGRFGIREVAILEEPFTEDAGLGYSFWITVNGIRTYCKGGNWIPLELWPAISKDEKYIFAIEKAKEANFTMLRVWGGGIYEKDIFYDLCDEMGIMVWQDFMFASTGYPLPKMRDDIIAEAGYQLLRLRNHPCITLWCGCNEDCFSWVDRTSGAISAQADIVESESDDEWLINRLRYDPELYTMILRGLVSKYSLGVPYIESSPQSRDGAGNNPSSGNSHISCWKYALFDTDGHHENYRGHFKRVCSFDSEFCIQGPSSMKYIKSFLREENHWPPNEAWIYHIQRGHHNLPHYKQTMAIAGATFGEIDSLQKYVKHGMATHVEHMRTEFESARHDYPNNGGTMMWMYLDCWPTSNWAIIDYDKNPKPAYYAAKRACEGVLPIIFERNGNVDFSISNHKTKSINCEVEYGIVKLSGEIVSSKKLEFNVASFDTYHFETLPMSEMKCNMDEYLFINATVDNEELKGVSYFPNLWKDVPFTPCNPEIVIGESVKDDKGYKTDIKITAPSFARLAHLLYTGDDNVWFSDNYFDIPAGRSVNVCVSSENPLDKNSIVFGDWFTEWE